MTNPSKPTNPWLEAGPFRYLPGYINGRRQPCIVVSIRPGPRLQTSSDVAAQQKLLQQFTKWWDSALYAATPTPPPSDWPSLAQVLASGTEQLLRYLGLPLLDSTQVSPAPPQQWTSITLPLPHCEPGLVLDAWQLLVQVLSQTLQTKKLPEPLLRKQLDKLTEEKQHSISPLMLKAAYDLDLPVTPLKGIMTQFGHGRQSAWLEHTFTENSANLSVRIARNKSDTAIRLRQMCLPVAPHHEVANVNEALQAAQALGYPVVVKPVALDGGVGVAANLANQQEVRAAYAIAQKQSPRVLIEKHVAGRDYRLTVLDGEMIWAVERIPAGVVGDGQHSIEQLIAKENLTDQRRPGLQQTLKPLAINSEARQLLQSSNLQPQSVPAKGQFVALRRTANVANGGRPKVVTEQVHPDNAALAIRATQALRLDLTGVDLIIPDISRSWREPGNHGVVCEINAQPDLGSTTAAHLYPMVLKKRVKGSGRIPIIALLGAPSDELTTQVVAALQAQGLQSIGWSGHNRAGINDVTLSTNGKTFAHSMMLLTDQSVDALVLNVYDDELLKRGLPTDKIDWLVLAGSKLTSPQLLQPLTSMMLGATRNLALLKESNLQPQGLEQALPTHLKLQTLSTAEFLSTLP
ncbi:hypothetical protein J6J08_06150 [Pseudidiomarina sp. 1APR75-33.1]|uniref:ATP-binding protein n=1 Tax=Pseudidiomarina terrestris TaxID=2820060 RepID=UPI002652B169|nr:hypothetical protein [Pseudidiomarina sp. 1APR75-33.1]MDN7126957.1 hypothetical protein [Pseudidiomarina sp. 1APR75-33.1]